MVSFICGSVYSKSCITVMVNQVEKASPTAPTTVIPAVTVVGAMNRFEEVSDGQAGEHHESNIVLGEAGYARPESVEGQELDQGAAAGAESGLSKGHGHHQY